MLKCRVRDVLLTTLGVIAGGVGPCLAGSISYSFDIKGVPDLDQRRMGNGIVIGLPGDGNQYCVPTGEMNWLAFIANRGYPDMLPGGPTNWNRPGGLQYSTMSLHLAALGNQMATDFAAGTNGNGQIAGLQNWLAAAGLDDEFVVEAQWVADSRGPTPDDIAGLLMRNALVCVSVGWYKSYVQGFATFAKREGGHCVTLTQFVGSGPSNDRRYAIGIHDPGVDEGDATRQSVFSTQQYQLSKTTRRLNSPTGPVVDFWNVDGYRNGATLGHIDGLVAIVPKQALVLDENDQLSLWDLAGSLTERHGSPRFVQLVTLPVHQAGVAMLPGRGVIAYLTQASQNDPAFIHTHDLNLGDGTLTIPFAAPTSITASRLGRLYVVDNNATVHCINPDNDTQEASAPAGFYVTSIAVSDMSDRVLTLDAEIDSIREFGADLSPGPVYALNAAPFGITVQDIMTVSQATDHAWVLLRDSGQIWEFVLSPGTAGSAPAGVVYLPPGTDPRSLVVDERDHVLVGTATGTLEYAYDTKIGQWSQVIDSPFSKLPSGRFVGLARSRSNFDPTLHTGPGWDVQVDPTDTSPSITECVADINMDGDTNGADLSVLLSTFGDNVEASEGADFNSDGTINGADLSVLLSNFGCQPPEPLQPSFE